MPTALAANASPLTRSTRSVTSTTRARSAGQPVVRVCRRDGREAPSLGAVTVDKPSVSLVIT
ncbi:hypothetical protein ACIHCQ_17030 [Streptomyces sp. NPDC052236]|uniref:hypothetical protein n=1 Tax=Streptomyces sp. NPDC052236 TaxID=3365686 RepID=UPI0037D89133